VNTLSRLLRKRHVQVYILLIVAILITYGRVSEFDFVNFDDDLYVENNPQVRSGINASSLRWAFTATYQGTWQPLVWLSYMLDAELSSLWNGYKGAVDASIYHLTNLIIHLLNTLLLFICLLSLTHSTWRSAFVAALFALHPLRIESVAWIAERKDVLSGLFWMLGIIAYANYVRRPGVAQYLLVAATLILGLMAKPILVTFPIVLMLLDYWPLCRFKSLRSEFVEKIPLLVLSAGSCVITITVQDRMNAVMQPIGVRIAVAVYSYARYLAKTIWPNKLAVFYPHPGSSLPVWLVIGSAFLLVVITLFCVLSARKHRFLLMGWMWYIVTLIPVIGIIQTGKHGWADRFTYIPLIGIFIMIAWGIPELFSPLCNRAIRIPLAFAAFLVLIVLAISTYVQLGYWRNSISLFQRALAVTRNNATAHYNLACALARKGDLEKAIYHAREAVRISPSFAEARNSIGCGLMQMNKLDEAIKEFRIAIRIRKDYSEAHSNLGAAYLTKGMIKEAIAEFRKALDANPNNSLARDNLQIALEMYEQSHH
jgi:hypothetical protein